MKRGAPDPYNLNGSDLSESPAFAVLIWAGIAAFAFFLAVVAMTYGVPDRNEPEASAAVGRLLGGDPMPTGSLGDDRAPPLSPVAPPIAAGGRSDLTATVDVRRPSQETADEIARLRIENSALRQTVEAMRNRVDMLTERVQSVEARFSELTGSVERQAQRRPPPAAAVAVPQPAPSAEALDVREMGTQFGIELGSYDDLASLKQGWRQLLQDDPSLFGGLTGLASLRDRNGRTELLLIAGPFPNARVASERCNVVEQSGRFCLPAFFVGQTLALR